MAMALSAGMEKPGSDDSDPLPRRSLYRVLESSRMAVLVYVKSIVQQEGALEAMKESGFFFKAAQESRWAQGSALSSGQSPTPAPVSRPTSQSRQAKHTPQGINLNLYPKIGRVWAGIVGPYEGPQGLSGTE